jgi:hypothetical protein
MYKLNLFIVELHKKIYVRENLKPYSSYSTEGSQH